MYNNQNNQYNNQQQQHRGYNQYGGGGGGGGGPQQQQQQYGRPGGGYNQQQNYGQQNQMVRYPNPSSMGGYNNQYSNYNNSNNYGNNSYGNQNNYQNYQQQNYNPQQYNPMGGQQQPSYNVAPAVPQQQSYVPQYAQPQYVQQQPAAGVVVQQPAQVVAAQQPQQLTGAGGFVSQVLVAQQPLVQAQPVVATTQPSYILASSSQTQNSFLQPGGLPQGMMQQQQPGQMSQPQQVVIAAAAPHNHQPQTIVQTVQPAGTMQAMQPITMQPAGSTVQFVQAAQQPTTAIVITDPITAPTPALISAPTPTPIVVNTSGGPHGHYPVSSAGLLAGGAYPISSAMVGGGGGGPQLIDPSLTGLTNAQQLALLHSQQQHQAHHLKKMKQRLPHVSGRELQALHKQIKELQIKQQHQTLQTLRLAKAQEKQAFKYLDSALKGRSGGAPRNASLHRVGFQLKVGNLILFFVYLINLGSIIITLFHDIF